ncbi:hypothetical protein B0H10DRAFT_1961941 [Mycena sp. CBHHK59/15]|nr:hypothetical protein B0H10DRAFT_1961941 [Mycena sp. CBHHK59/15]
MVEQIHEILCAIVNLELTHRIDGVLPQQYCMTLPHLQSMYPSWLRNAPNCFLKDASKSVFFRQVAARFKQIKLLFKHFDHTSQLQECKNELQSALDKFRIQSSTETQARMVQMQKTVEEQHQQLLALIAAHPDLIDSTVHLHSGSISILPASPQIFHGRTSELSEVVELLKQESARIAILGTGGMGKTSLATAALHHGDIVDRFPNRVFVLCHSTLTCSDLVKSIASHIGVEQGPNLERRIVLALWKQFRGLPSQDIIRQLSANFGNFNSILEDGLDRDLPDIIQTLRSVLVFDAFVRMHSNAPSPIMQRLTLQIPLWKDHPVYGAYLQNRLFSSRTSPIPDPDTEIALGNQYFENADDLEKAQWNNALAAYYTIQGNQIEKALHCRQLALSLTNSTPNPSRPALQALTGIANITCSMGDYTTGQSYAQQAQQMAELLGDLLGQALAISMEARCCFSVGDFVCAAKLCRHGREVLQACGLQGTDTDLRLQSFEAEVHELKTEYLEARAIHVAVAASRSRGNMDNFSQLNIAVIDIAIGADSQRLYQTLQAARRQPMPPMAALFYEIAYADLLLRDENLAALSPPVGELAGMSLDVSEGSGSSRTIGASSRMPA